MTAVGQERQGWTGFGSRGSKKDKGVTGRDKGGTGRDEGGTGMDKG